MSEIYSGLFGLLFCLVVIPLGIGMIGYRLGERAEEKRQAARPLPSAPTTEHPTTPNSAAPASTTAEIDPGTRTRWMLWELQREPMASTLTVEQRVQLTQNYRERLQSKETEPVAPAPEAEETASPEVAQPAPTLRVDVPHPMPTMQAGEARPATLPDANVPASTHRIPYTPPPDEDKPVRHGRELDPAVMLLYVGALLIVASGIIYAAYNWADFSAWHKLGALAAATLAFIAAGIGFRRNDRLEPAANTFLTIGALLVPVNAVAAWQVLDGANARPELPLFFGALVTAIVHGAFSIRPGGRIYDYVAVISTAIAAASLPAAIGAEPLWGVPLTLAVLAGVPVLAGPLERLNRPRLLVSMLGAPIVLWAVWFGFTRGSDERWVVPVTLAVVTFALLRVPRFAPGLRRYAEIAATVMLLAIIPATINALDVLDTFSLRNYGFEAISIWDEATLRAWGIVALLTAIVWTAAMAGVPRLRELHLSTTMTVEAGALFLMSYTLFSEGDQYPWALVAALAGVTAMTLIAWLRDWSWLLLASAGYLLYGWAALAFAFGIDDASDLDKLRLAAFYPIVVMAGALAVQRLWHASRREAGSLPLWLVTLVSVAFIVVTGVDLALDEPSVTLAVIVTLLAMAAVVLVTAYAMDASRVLLGYGAIWSAVIVLGAERWVADGLVLPVVFAVATLVAIGSVLLAGRIAGTDAAPLRLLAQPRPRLEAIPLGGLAIFALLSVIAESVQSIVATYTRPEGNDVELSASTWGAHLAVFALMIVVSFRIGLRTRDDVAATQAGEALQSLRKILTWIPLLFGLLIIASVTSMVTRDLLEATWVWLATAMVIIVCGALWRPDRDYVQGVRTTLSLSGPILLGTVVLLNLPASSNGVSDGQLLGQVIVYGGLGLAAGALGVRTRSSNDLYAMTILLTIGCWFGTRYVDSGNQATMLAFVALAWVFAGIGVIAYRRGSSSFATLPLTISSLAISALSLPASLAETNNLADSGADELRVLAIIWLLSLAGLLALSGWLYRRRDLAFWGSGLAVLALLLQIGSRSPDNIHAFTLPITAWLFALGLIERNHSSRANGLFGAGAAFLVLPGLWMAQSTGQFSWLVIVLIEGVVLFVAGLLLRLRIPIAAGVVTLSILVLRMLIDVVNAMPNWVALLTAGLILLIGGTVWISFRDDIRARVEGLRSRWGRFN